MTARDLVQSIVTSVPFILVLSFTREQSIRFFHEQLHLGFWATTFALVAEVLLAIILWVPIVQFAFRVFAPRQTGSAR